MSLCAATVQRANKGMHPDVRQRWSSRADWCCRHKGLQLKLLQASPAATPAELAPVVHQVSHNISVTPWCRYKGSMDARTFQQHSARVAELTDVLLAERAAAKAAQSPAKPGPASASPAAGQNHSQQPRPNPSEAHTPVAKGSNTPELAVGDGRGPSPGAPAESAQSAYSSASKPTASAQVMPASHGISPDGSSSEVAGTHHCTICNISTTSAVHLQTHYMGSKHQRRLAQAQEGMQDELDPHYCAICGITATSDVHLQLHLNGRAHQRKARLASETGQASGTHGYGQASDTPMHEKDAGGAFTPDQHSSDAQLSRDSRGSSLSGSSQAGMAADSQGMAASAAAAGASRQSTGGGNRDSDAETNAESAARSAANHSEQPNAAGLPVRGDSHFARSVFHSAGLVWGHLTQLDTT